MSILVTYVLKWLRNGPYGLWEWIDVNWKHTINEKAVVRYTHTHTHTTYTLEGNNLQKKNWWILFCFLQASCWQTDRQTDGTLQVTCQCTFRPVPSPLLIEWRWEGRGRGGKWINKLWGLAKSFPSCVSPLPTEESSSWWGMSILLFVMCKAPKQTAAITSSTTTEGLVG